MVTLHHSVNVRQALLDIAQTIGRVLRDDADNPPSYAHVLDALDNVEDQLTALAAVIEAAETTPGRIGQCELCGEPAGAGGAICPACAKTR